MRRSGIVLFCEGFERAREGTKGASMTFVPVYKKAAQKIQISPTKKREMVSYSLRQKNAFELIQNRPFRTSVEKTSGHSNGAMRNKKGKKDPPYVRIKTQPNFYGDDSQRGHGSEQMNRKSQTARRQNPEALRSSQASLTRAL